MTLALVVRLSDTIYLLQEIFRQITCMLKNPSGYAILNILFYLRKLPISVGRAIVSMYIVESRKVGVLWTGGFILNNQYCQLKGCIDIKVYNPPKSILAFLFQSN